MAAQPSPDASNDASLNQIALHASIVELLPMRSTPAGLPVIEMWLEHASEQSEDGHARQVALRIKAKALGIWAETFARQPIGSVWRFQGFLASPGRTRQAVLHVRDAQACAVAAVHAPDIASDIAPSEPEPV